jgi:hypothetical protein
MSGKEGKVEIHHLYTMSGENGSVSVVKVLHIGKTFVKVQTVEGKGAGTEPYFVRPSDWEWQKV